MVSRTLPVRDARLGRPVAPGVDPDGAVRAAVLLLPEGVELSTRRRSPVAAAAMWPLARQLVRAGRREGLVAHLVHYRFRGWNDGHAHPAEDAEWAVGEVVRRYGDVSVCLVGMGMGARAALRAAGHPAVGSVVALAPRLPEPPEPGPVGHLLGRRVLIVHGTDDRRCAPTLSYRLAERIKKVNPDVCRFEVHSDGHGLRQHRREVLALTEDFVLGSLFGQGYARPVTDALAAPPPLGLRMPLAAGFARTVP